MCSGKTVLNLLIAVLLVFVFTGQVWSQPAGKGPDRRPSRDPDQRRQMFTGNLRKTLDFSEEEWQIIEPRLQKVVTLSAKSSGMGGRKGGPMGQVRSGGKGKDDTGNQTGQSRSPREQTAMGSLLEDLNTVLKSEDATPSQIEEKLAAVRVAREESKIDLAKAQAELRELLTLRQEALLVMMGILN